MRKRILDFLLYIRPEPDRIEFLERLRLLVLYALAVPAVATTVYNVILVLRTDRYLIAVLLCITLLVGSLAFFFSHAAIEFRSPVYGSWVFSGQYADYP